MLAEQRIDAGHSEQRCVCCDTEEYMSMSALTYARMREEVTAMCYWCVCVCVCVSQDCQGKLARSKAVVRQLANGVNVSLEFLAQHPNPPDSVRELIDTAKIFRKIRGELWTLLNQIPYTHTQTHTNTYKRTRTDLPQLYNASLCHLKCLCVCVRVCVRACVSVCVCVSMTQDHTSTQTAGPGGRIVTDSRHLSDHKRCGYITRTFTHTHTHTQVGVPEEHLGCTN